MNHTQLKTLFAGIGTSFAGFTTLTAPATMASSKYHNKKGHPPVVLKRSVFTAFLMAGERAYAQRVDTKSIKATVAMYGERDVELPPYQAKSLWHGRGRHTVGCNVVHLNDKDEPDRDFVFMFCDVSTQIPKVEYIDAVTGQPVSAADVTEVDKKSYKTIDLGNGVTVEIRIMPRTVALDSIEALRIDGVEHIIDHSEITEAAVSQAPAAEVAPAQV